MTFLLGLTCSWTATLFVVVVVFLSPTQVERVKTSTYAQWPQGSSLSDGPPIACSRLIDHLLSNKRYADCAAGREQAAEGNGRLIGIKSGIDLTIEQPERGGGGVIKNWNAQTGVACREDAGRDVRSFLTEMRSEQSSRRSGGA